MEASDMPEVQIILTPDQLAELVDSQPVTTPSVDGQLCELKPWDLTSEQWQAIGRGETAEFPMLTVKVVDGKPGPMTKERWLVRLADEEAELRRHAQRLLVLIRADQVAGTVPPGLSSFDQLHDYVDANEYLVQVAEEEGVELTGKRLAFENRAIELVNAELRRDKARG
jgi:hypothetical protein